MTAARNTSHWIIQFLGAFIVTEDSSYLDAAKKGLAALESSDLFPTRRAFVHRADPRRDEMNGLIGQAWTLEALAYAWRLLSDRSFRDVAFDVIASHPFDANRGLWHRIDRWGNDMGCEETINQQIWFAAMVAQVDASLTLDGNRPLDRFLTRLPDNLALTQNGYFELAARRSLSVVQTLKRRLRPPSTSVRDKRVGYHAFSLCGLALLRRASLDHDVWRSPIFRVALQTTLRGSFHRALLRSPFGFTYNVPGFELPFVWSAFSDIVNEADSDRIAAIAEQMIRAQLACGTSTSKQSPWQDPYDADTLEARNYELVRLLPDAAFEVAHAVQ